MQICRLCGHAVRTGARFCPRCGTDPQARVCAGCGQPNPAGAKSCRQCGKFLVQICTQCNRENKLAARFCVACGAGLTVCPHCGGRNRPGARFCQQCGQDPTNVHCLPLVVQLIHQRYQIQGLIARGGMGAVYEVRDIRQPGSVWALKEIVLDGFNLAEHQEAIESFRQEAKILSTLSHPNLPRFIDYFTDGGKEYLVMERVQGENLDTVRNHAPMAETTVLPIAFQLCDVLNYLHHRQPPIIYRDLKPSNIMVEPASGFIKLIDFGIARFHKPGKKKDTLALGTPGFAPPEQYGNGQTDARSDIFALGVTLHVLLTNYDVEQNPWNYPPANTLNAAVSQRLEQVIGKATEMEVRKRFQTIAEIREALLRCKGGKEIAHHLSSSNRAWQPAASSPQGAVDKAASQRGGVPPVASILVNKPALKLKTQKHAEVLDQFWIKSTQGAGFMIDLTTSATWLEVMPKTWTGPNEEIQVCAHTDHIDLPRIQRPTPNLLTRAWRWAEQQGAQRKPWEQPDAWGATLWAGLPALVGGALAYGLTWAVYQHAYYFVPGGSREQGEITLTYPGGAQTIPVTLEVEPSKPRVILGWVAAAVAVAGELGLAIWLL